MPRPARTDPRHPCLLPADGVDPASFVGTDQHRLALVLEAAAVTSLLSSCGCVLDEGLSRAVVGRDGHLAAVGFVAGSRPADCREPLVRLLRALFGGVAGRGQARRAARRLLEEWRAWPGFVGADAAAAAILEMAPFLWGPRFGGSRARLVGIVRAEVGARWWVAGPPWLRQILHERGGPTLRDVLAGSRARELLSCRAATEIREQRPSPSGGELTCVAEAGDWKRVASLARRGRDAGGGADLDLVLHGCRATARLGRSRRAVECLRRAEIVASRQSTTRSLVALHRRWLELCCGAPSNENGEGVVTAQVPARLAELPVQWWSTWAEVNTRMPATPAVARELGSALLRRTLPSGTRGRLWCALARFRRGRGDLEAAERALVHAYRSLHRAGGRHAAAEALTELAGLRIARHRLASCDDLLDCARRAASAASDRVVQRRVREVLVCLHVARRNPAGVLEVVGAVRDRDRQPFEALAVARALGWSGRSREAADALRGATEATTSSLAALWPEERALTWLLAGSPERARQSARDDGWESGWSRLVAEGDLTAVDPDPVRRARAVHDLSIAGVAVAWQMMREAEKELLELGAVEAAARVRDRRMGPWAALRRFLELGAPTIEDLGVVLSASGPRDLRLCRFGEDGEEEVLCSGRGGSDRMEARLPFGRFSMSAARLDDPLRCVFLLAGERMASRSSGLGREVPPDDGLVGESRAFRQAMARVSLLAPSRLSVLLEGETGTGKELVARRVHASSDRASGPFVPVNCAALSESLLLSELFGHARGSFTGAQRDHAGVFESASGGTVFLDEIGDLPLTAQGSLLRVLQEGEVRRLGETRLRRVDVRVVAATHRNLGERVRKGNFRGDLYYRLRAARVVLPPLRDRGEDVIVLALHFLSRIGSTVVLSTAARRRLEAHSWPGNVRELRNVIEVADRLRGGRRKVRAVHLDLPERAASAPTRYHEALDAERRRLVSLALDASGGKRSNAARRLGITPQALSYIVRRLDLGEIRPS